MKIRAVEMASKTADFEPKKCTEVGQSGGVGAASYHRSDIHETFCCDGREERVSQWDQFSALFDYTGGHVGCWTGQVLAPSPVSALLCSDVTDTFWHSLTLWHCSVLASALLTSLLRYQELFSPPSWPGGKDWGPLPLLPCCWAALLVCWQEIGNS